MPTTLLVANEHRIVREALRALLETRGDLSVVGFASDGQEAAELALRLRPDIVLMDVAMPNLGAPEATRRIARPGGRSKVLILATRATEGSVEEVLRAGAAGCLLRESEPAELFAAVDAIRRGQVYLSPSVGQRVVDALLAASPPRGEAASPLTGREREVLQLLAEGHSSKEIATRLHISMRTVDTHRSAVMRKLGVSKASALGLFAVRHGLIIP
jgi:DNA-binding NarL/FixJ family response regulator